MGGTVQNFAEALGRLINKEITEAHLKVKRSGGSVENLLAVNEGKMTLALVHAEDAYLGDAGQLAEGIPPTKNVAAVARLFGSFVHLVVPISSPHRSPYDLRKSRIAIGNPGSSSAQSAERYFRNLGIWDEIIPIYVSNARGLKELVSGSVDAVWALTEVPNPNIQETNREFPLRLLGLWEETSIGKFFQSYPYYSLSTIPQGIYPWEEREVYTLESPILLLTNFSVDGDFIYRLMTILFSEEGLKSMRSMHPAARDLDIRKAAGGVNISYHPGALRFLNENL